MKSCQEEEGMRLVHGREKKGMPLKVAIMSDALGHSLFVPGVVNGRRWSREADMVSQLTSCRGFFLAMS